MRHLRDEDMDGDDGGARSVTRRSACIELDQGLRSMNYERRSSNAAQDSRQPPEDRGIWIGARDIVAARQARAREEREELVRLRDLAWEARRAGEDARAERERLLGQLREANAKLATAQQLLDEANAARAAAEHNEERFRSLIYTSSALVWQATSEGRFEVAPEPWRQLTGLDVGPGETGWLEAVHPDDRERVRRAWTEAVAAATPYTCEHRIRSSSGGYVWVVARAVPVPMTETGRPWIGMMTDVSDRVRVEKSRDQFIGILGHDLRNPLAAILMAVEMLGELPEPYPATVARVARSARRIEAMVRDLLDFARGRLAGGIPVVPRPCDLKTVCKDVVEEMQQAHPDCTLSFDAAGDLHGQWDPDRVEQVISNLVANAVTHGTGAVRVSAHDDGDEVVTTVHNDGRPIPAAVLPILFEPFTRPAPGSAPVRTDGLGLGLYIASEIVHAHGATLSVTSTAGQGTSFTIRWARSAVVTGCPDPATARR